MTRLGEKLSPPLVASLILLMLAAFVILRSGNATVRGNEINFDRAVFVVTNAATLTGFQLTVNVTDYKTLGQGTIFALMVASSLVSLLVGGWALARVLKLPFSDIQILNYTLILYVLVLVLGANVLIEKDGDLFAAFFNTASAFGNSGHWIGSLPDFTMWRTHLILLPLAFLGGLGVPVILDLVTCPFALRRPHPHTFAVLTASAVFFLLAICIIFLLEKCEEVETRTAIQLAATESLNSRALGMPFNTFTMLSRPAQWVALVLMLIGAAPAGTGGGLKVTTPFVLIRDSIRSLLGLEIGPALGMACLWTMLYLLVVLVSTVLLILSYPQIQSDRLLFMAVSAAGNVGSSQEPITLTGNGLYILTFAMLFGRFGPMALLWWMAYSVPGEVDVGV